MIASFVEDPLSPVGILRDADTFLDREPHRRADERAFR
jgi:hypothetical protein